MAEKNAGKINEHDIWNNSVIGIDTNAHKLFCVKEATGNQLQQEINLVEVQKCRLNNVSKTVNTPDGKQTLIEKLELIFIYHDHSKPETFLEFYNSKLDNLSINEEFALTGKWLEIINLELLSINNKK